MFFKWSDLGSNVHVTDAKVEDAYSICTQINHITDTKADDAYSVCTQIKSAFDT
jgi:hypothetical protein